MPRATDQPLGALEWRGEWNVEGSGRPSGVFLGQLKITQVLNFANETNEKGQVHLLGGAPHHTLEGRKRKKKRNLFCRSQGRVF